MKLTATPAARDHTLEIGLAKHSFSLHGVDGHGKPIFTKTMLRGKLLEHLQQLPTCIISMEACSGAHHRARCVQTMGHTARIMVPRFVAPYRKGGKNDGSDAEVICEASRTKGWAEFNETHRLHING